MSLERYQEPLVLEPGDEWPKVEAWRLHVLLDEAHYPLRLAEQLAARPDVDLHQAVELVEHGCSHETATHILL